LRITNVQLKKHWKHYNVKINNIHLLDGKQLGQSNNIWRMTREQLWDFTDSLWEVIENPSPQDTLATHFGEELHNEVHKRLEQLAKEDEKKRYATVTVEDEDYETITYFNMYHLGWECDTKGFVVKTADGPKFVLTNHGTAHFASEETIKNKIKELNGAVKAMKSALTAVELG
jgi:hypothetical protein